MQIFKGNQEQLKQTYNLNALIIMRIGVLRSKNILLTEPIIELCKTNEPLEELFKDRSVLNFLDNQSQFNILQKKYNIIDTFPLVILDNGTEKVIALSDEILAEQGWEDASSNDLPALQKSALNPQLNLQGVEHLFSEEEIARLKMTIATAVSSAEKIEAMRKISISQVDANEKSLLFLHILGDNDVVVRREAAFALGKSDLNEQMGNAIIALCSGDEKQKAHAINSLGNLFNEASEFEKGAVLQIFLTTIKDKDYHTYVLEILEILANIIPGLPANDKMIHRIMNNALENLISDFEHVYEKMYQIFAAVKKLNIKQVDQFLWIEINKTNERRLRSFLLTLFSDFTNEEAQYSMILELGFGDELDPVYIRLINVIKSAGEKILPILLKRFSASMRVTEKIQLLQVIDNIVTKKISNLSKENIIKTFIACFASSHKLLRPLIMDMKILQDNELSFELRLLMAKELLVDISNETLDQYNDTVRSCLCRMKDVSVTAILEVLENPISMQQANLSASILGDVVFALSNKKEIARVQKFCFVQIEKKLSYTDELYKILGRLVTLTTTSPEEAKEISQYLIDNVCKSARPYSIIEGLSWAGSSIHIEHELKYDIGYLFMTLLDRDIPGHFMKDKKEAENTTLYEINFKVTAFTELLPFLIKGLEQISISSNTPISLQKKIIAKLLQKWQEIINFKLIWGPKNTLDLAHSLQKIALLDALETDTKVEIIEALLKKIEIFSITELLADIFMQDISEKKILDLSYFMASKLLEFNKDKDLQSPEDKTLIMKCIGKMATGKSLHNDEKKSEQLRERLVFSLFEGLRERVFRIKTILSKLTLSKNIPKKLSLEIEKRLPHNRESVHTIIAK